MKEISWISLNVKIKMTLQVERLKRVNKHIQIKNNLHITSYILSFDIDSKLGEDGRPGEDGRREN
jgi:hypothetical protein